MADDLRSLMQQASEEEHDTETFGPTKDEVMSALSEAAQESLDLRAEVARLEDQISASKSRIKELEEKRIPELMEEIGMRKFELSDGSEITVKHEVYCSLLKENQERAFSWLEEHGHGSIIKHVISCEFRRGEDAEAKKLRELLDEASLPYADKEIVYPATLKSWAREEVENGRFPPDDIFNVYEATVAKIKPAKK